MSPIDVRVDVQRAVLQAKRIEQTTVQRNKQRGLRYERMILPKLGAKRVPSSGAGVLKGDGVLVTSYGLALVECKYQSAIKRSREDKNFKLTVSWLGKILDDVTAMRYAFGMLVFHTGSSLYHYTAVPMKYIPSIFPTPPCVYYRYTSRDKVIEFIPDVDFEPVCRFGAVAVDHPVVPFLVFDAFLLRDYLISSEHSS